MTILAFKDGIMAADTAVWSENATCGHAMKIGKSPNGTLFGAAGNGAVCQRFLDHMKHDNEPDKFEVPDDGDFAGLVVYQGGNLVLYVSEHGVIEVAGEFFSEGAAADMAYGAMAAGATAARAVQICIENHQDAGGRVETLNSVVCNG